MSVKGRAFDKNFDSAPCFEFMTCLDYQFCNFVLSVTSIAYIPSNQRVLADLKGYMQFRNQNRCVILSF